MYYRTTREVMIDLQKEVNRYNKLKEQIRKDIKKYRTLAEATKNEDYKLAYNMIADYLDETIKEK